MSVKILGHRGYKSLYPENTTLAINRAFELCDGVEFDIQKTADGHFVIIHDDTVDRTSDGMGRVDQLLLEDLKKMDFGQGERICTLNELLQSAPHDKILNIELKHETIRTGDSAILIDMIKNTINPQRVVVSSFNPVLLYPFVNAGIKTGYLIGDKNFKYDFKTVFQTVISLKPYYMNLPIAIYTDYSPMKRFLFFLFIKLYKKGIIYWTVNSQQEFNCAIKNADMIITNEVEKIRFLLKGEKNA